MQTYSEVAQVIRSTSLAPASTVRPRGEFASLPEGTPAVIDFESMLQHLPLSSVLHAAAMNSSR